MSVNTNIFAGFGIRRAWVATPAASPSWIEIPAITSAAFKAAVSEVEQTGNDAILDTWYYGQKGTIAVKATRAAMTVFSALSGTSTSSTSSFQKIDIGRSAELVPPVVAVRGLIIGKDDSLNKVHIIGYWYKTHVKTAFETFPDSAYGKLSEVTLSFECYPSTTDETATTLTKSAIGRIEVWDPVSSPLASYE